MQQTLSTKTANNLTVVVNERTIHLVVRQWRFWLMLTCCHKDIGVG